MKTGGKPKNTWLDWLLTALGLGTLLGITLYLLLYWGQLPEEIPTHFNAAGEIDAFGGKTSLLSPLIIGWVLYGLISLIEAIPAAWNTGVEVTPENRETVLRTIKTMLSVLKLILALFFSYLILFSVLCRPLHSTATFLYLIAIFGTILWSCIRLFKKRKK